MALIMVGVLATQIADLQKHIGRPIRDIWEISPYALQINCSGPWCDHIVLLDIVKGRRCNAIFRKSATGHIASVKTFGAGCPGNEMTLKKILIDSLLHISLEKKISEDGFALLVGPPNTSLGWGDFGNELSYYKLDEFLGVDTRESIDRVQNSPCGFKVYFKQQTIHEYYPLKDDNCWFEYYPGELGSLEKSD
ncbi:MAG: hypothetical protein OXU79_08940 [Gemmatimonadota bacterium]|nr:hypothetical protein [Gemmatimonadota bacterium]